MGWCGVANRDRRTMKKRYFICGFFGAIVLIIFLGAAFPAPIWRNNFSTNEPPFPVIGDWYYSNSVQNSYTNYIFNGAGGIGELEAGVPVWLLSPPKTGLAGLSVGNGFGLWGPTLGAFDVQFYTQFTNATRPGVRFIGSPNQMNTNYFQIEDTAGNAIAYMRSNVFWATTNDFFATLQTTDNTTNNILTLTPRDNSAVRVKVDVVGYNSTSSASYGKLATFKSVAGTVTQVGSVASLGVAEDDAAYECLIDISANIIRVRVAGNTAKTVNWKCYLNTTYSE
jgi:hypothetical protein